jgi:hypothetical protein
MTRPDEASELPHSKEVLKQTQGGTIRTTPSRRPAVTEFKDGSAAELQKRCVTGV